MSNAKKAIKAVVEGRDPKSVLESSKIEGKVDFGKALTTSVTSKAKKEALKLAKHVMKNIGTDRPIYFGDLLQEISEDINPLDPGDGADEKAEQDYFDTGELISDYVLVHFGLALAKLAAQSAGIPANFQK